MGSCAISLNLCYKSQFITIASKTKISYRNSKTASFVSSIFPNLIFCFSYFRAAFETLKLHHYNDGRKTEVDDPDYGLNVPKSSNADQSPTPQGSKKIGKKYAIKNMTSSLKILAALGGGGSITDEIGNSFAQSRNYCYKKYHYFITFFVIL